MFRKVLVLFAVGLVLVVPALVSAQCNGGRCSRSSNQISQNEQILNQQEEQIRELQTQIDRLSSVLQQRLQDQALVRNAVPPAPQERLVKIGRSDDGQDFQFDQLRIQPIQLVQRNPAPQNSTVNVQAPSTRVQVGQQQSRQRGGRWRR
jgi:hypothetical protein